MGRTAVVVDIDAIGFMVDSDDFRTEPAEDIRTELGSRSIGPVMDDF